MYDNIPPPNIYVGGTSMVMSPNILEVMSTRVTTRNYVQIPKEMTSLLYFSA